MGLGFAGIRELLCGDDQPDSLVVLHELALVVALLCDMSKKCLDGFVGLFASKGKNREKRKGRRMLG